MTYVPYLCKNKKLGLVITANILLRDLTLIHELSISIMSEMSKSTMDERENRPMTTFDLCADIIRNIEQDDRKWQAKLDLHGLVIGTRFISHKKHVLSSCS